MKLYQLLIFLGFISCSAFYSKAETDTLYFSDNWEVASQNNFTYYRILEVKDSVIYISDHYNNGNLQMLGSIKFTEKNMKLARTQESLKGHEIGLFSWFNQNGMIYYSIDYTPSIENLDSVQIVAVDTSALIEERTYYSNGSVKEKGLTTPEGVPHGRWQEFDRKSGKVIAETNFLEGELYGTQCKFRDNGVMYCRTEYFKGKKHGTEKIYDHLGRLKLTRTYKDGVLLKEKKRYLGFTSTR